MRRGGRSQEGIVQSGQTLNITSLIDDVRLTSFQIRVFVLCGLVMAFDGLDLTVVGVTAPSIAATLNMKMSAFGPIFGAGQFGVMIGAIVFGSPADRWGRRSLLISATILFGVFALLTATATSFGELVTYRFVTGLGLGGAAPNLVALISEYAPKRMRPLFVTIIWGFVPVGGIVGGLSSSYLIPHFGWQAVYFCGGVIPLVLAVFLLFLLPESVTFLVAREASPARIAKIVRRLDPRLAVTANTRFEINEEKLPGVPVKHLFTEGRTGITLTLWALFFLSFLLVVFGISWLPSLLRQHGATTSQMGIALALWSLGGIIGSVIFGGLVERISPYTVQIWGYILLAIGIGSLGFIAASSSFAVAVTFAFITSILGSGTNSVVGTLTALNYPTAMRSTAIGWGYGLGRAGATVGPMLGATFLGWNWNSDQIWLAFAVPSLLSAALILSLRRRIAARDASSGSAVRAAPPLFGR
jgi:MFS transporter, AAHS family, 4-hydroxybenzoate transporter